MGAIIARLERLRHADCYDFNMSSPLAVASSLRRMHNADLTLRYKVQPSCQIAVKSLKNCLTARCLPCKIASKQQRMPNMPEIRANPSALEASASVIEANVSAIQRELSAANDLLSGLRRTFIGQRAESFFRQYDAAYAEMQGVVAQMQALAEELRQSARALRAADQG